MELIIRFGAYGDPAALPEWLITSIADNCKDFTGYTHQWNKRKFNYLKNYFMASVETKKLAEKALKKGFRYFDYFFIMIAKISISFKLSFFR